jgi:hypothetical protein
MFVMPVTTGIQLRCRILFEDRLDSGLPPE